MYDLDAAIAEKRSKGPGPFPFRFAGQDFSLPAEVDLVAVDLIGKGDILGGLCALMGDEQYQRLIDVPEVLSADAFQMLLTEWMAHVGVNPGEGPASTSS